MNLDHEDVELDVETREEKGGESAHHRALHRKALSRELKDSVFRGCPELRPMIWTDITGFGGRCPAPLPLTSKPYAAGLIKSPETRKVGCDQ